MKKILYLFAVIALVTTVACNRKEQVTQGKQAAPTEQRLAPDIIVNGFNGAPLQLSSLKGKVVMLNFWATWCPPCREEIPSIIKLNSKMAGKPFQLVTVPIDEGGKPAVEAFFNTSGYSLPAYIDPDGRAAKTYGITGVPETYLIDKNGILVKKVIGPLEWDSPEVASYLEELMR